MFTTGSKFLIGSTVVAIVAAIVYGTTQNWLTGTIGLFAAGIALGVLAGFNIYTRDANVAVTPDLVTERTAAAQLAPGYSLWPLLMAFGGVTVVVGLVTYQAIFIIGTILLLAGGGEWMAQAWAERASADSVHNANVRSRMANPFEFPIAGVVAIGIIVYSFSRIMLWLSKTNTVFAFGAAGGDLPGVRLPVRLPAVDQAAGGDQHRGHRSGRPRRRRRRGRHRRRTRDASRTRPPRNWRQEGLCEDPGHTEADENASQNVAATASVAGRITLADDGTLSYEVERTDPGR